MSDGMNDRKGEEKEPDKCWCNGTLHKKGNNFTCKCFVVK